MFKRNTPPENSPEAKWNEVSRDISSSIYDAIRLNKTPRAILGGGWIRVSRNKYRPGTLPLEIKQDEVSLMFSSEATGLLARNIGFIGVRGEPFRKKNREYTAVAGVIIPEQGFEIVDSFDLNLPVFASFEEERQDAIMKAANSLQSTSLWTYSINKPDSF